MSMDRFHERNVQNEMSRCVHFTGLQHKVCRAGVSYDTARDVQRRALSGFPLLACMAPEVTTCASRELPTRQQAEARVDESGRIHEAFFAKLKLGICATCEDESTDFRQDGKCIYSVPCGHRVGQGKASEYKAGVEKARAERTP